MRQMRLSRRRQREHSRQLRRSFSAPAACGAAESRAGVSFVRGADNAKRKSLSIQRFVLALEVVEVLQIVGSVSEANERKLQCGHSCARPVTDKTDQDLQHHTAGLCSW